MSQKEQQLASRLGKAIAVRRQEKRLTQAELAEAIGVEQETISRFERGATLPPLGRLVDIADVICCPLENLLRDGSLRLEDKAQSIALAMDGLSDSDIKLVSEFVEQICERLRK